MDKTYIAEQYRLAWLDFQTARTADDQWDARRTMARLEALAAERYGYDYADSLRELRT